MGSSFFGGTAGNFTRVRRITSYASTGLSCLDVLGYLPVGKQKTNNRSLEILKLKLKRHFS
jgi:hypothetical protein